MSLSIGNVKIVSENRKRCRHAGDDCSPNQNLDRSQKLRRNKKQKVCENKRNLRINIEECPTLLSSGIEFGPWKADTHGDVKGGTFLPLLRFSSG